jgi:ATP-binding cassette subfamily F protein uup
MALLRIHNMSMGFGGDLLFDKINLNIEKGERICFVGRNGEGKTSLLNIISNSISPDEGEIYRRPGLQEMQLEAKKYGRSRRM